MSVTDPCDTTPKNEAKSEAELCCFLIKGLEDAMVSDDRGEVTRVGQVSSTETDLCHGSCGALNKEYEWCDQEGGDPATDTDSGVSGSLNVSNGTPPRDLSRGTSEELLIRDSQVLDISLQMRELQDFRECGSPDGWGPVLQQEGTSLQFRIEEQIEEITTHEVDSSDSEERGITVTCEGQETSVSPPHKCLKHFQKMTVREHCGEEGDVLPSGDFPVLDERFTSSPQRVAFPELGADLVQESSLEDEEEALPSDFLLLDNSWEENWLFRKQRKARVSVDDLNPVGMLIPNPMSIMPTTIGNRDIDELSELSERNSICSGDLSIHSDSETECSGAPPHMYYLAADSGANSELKVLAGEIVNEFGQKDHEYTEDYSGLSQLAVGSLLSHSQDIGTQTVEGPHLSIGCLSSARLRNCGSQHKISRTLHPSPQEGSAVRRPRKVSSLKDLATLAPRPVSLPPPPPSPPRHPEDVLPCKETVWFVALPEDINVLPGRTVRLSCQVNAKQVVGVSWYFRDQLLAASRDVLLWDQGDIHYLNIFNASSQHEGTYAVAAYTKDDCVWAFCEVTCSGPMRTPKPPVLNFGPTDVVAEVGEEVTLECQVGGHPEPRVLFFRNSEEVKPSSAIIIDNDPYGTWTLRLGPLLHEGQEVIEVVAVNANGAVKMQCHLMVVPEGSLTGQWNRIQHAMATTKAAQQNKLGITKEKHHRSKDCLNLKKCSSLDVGPQQSKELLRKTHSDDSTCAESSITFDVVEGDISLTPPKPGTIAEREYRKWLDAAPVPNNPYAPERLIHRLEHSFLSHVPLSGFKSDASLDEQETCPYRTDLTRYARDYHVGTTPVPSSKVHHSTSTDKSEYGRVWAGFLKNSYSSSTLSLPVCLKPLEEELKCRETIRIQDWKEELKEIQTDVSKKIADLQKTIDATQKDWENQLTRSATKFGSLTNCHTSSVLSPSPDLATETKVADVRVYKPSYGGYRHVVYSSNEALNRARSSRGANGEGLWRTVSVDTLPISQTKETLFSHALSKKVYDHSANCEKRRHTRVKHSDPGTTSDSDDLSCINDSDCQASKMRGTSKQPVYKQSSSESGVEDSESEHSSTVADILPQLPSVKELASRFDSQNSSGSESQPSRKYREVNHSLTARSVPRYFREACRRIEHSSLPPLTCLGPSSSTDFICASKRDNAAETKMDIMERNAPSPEHLGIPIKPASIPQRPHAIPGDTSDDSTITPKGSARRFTKKRSTGNIARVALSDTA